MGFGGFTNKSTLEMGMMEMNMEEDTTSTVIEFCMLMMGESEYIDYNCQLVCSNLNTGVFGEATPNSDEEPPLVYTGNVEVEQMDMDSDTVPDFSIPFMAIVGTAILTYMDMETGEFDETKTVTVSGSVSFREITVSADIPTDLMELQMGISMDDMMNMMGDIDKEIPINSVTFNADGTYSTHEEHITVEYDNNTDTETQNTFTVNCTGPWEVDSTYGISLGEEECSDSGEEGENGDEGYGGDAPPMGDDMMQTFVINSGGYLVVSQSSNSFCAIGGGSLFDFEEDDNSDGDGTGVAEGEMPDEEECKQVLEYNLAFDAGSLVSASIYMSMIYSQDSASREIYIDMPRNIESKAIIRHIKRHNRKILPPWALN